MGGVSLIIGDSACPECRKNGADSTGNHLIHFSDGNKACNRCGYKEIITKRGSQEPSEGTLNMNIAEVLALPYKPLTDRLIKAEIAEKYGVKTEIDTTNGETSKHFYPYYQGSNLIGYKVRGVADKSFWKVGEIKDADLFGMHLVGTGGKMLVITEGECDCMAVSQMLKEQGKNYRVVSLPNGANANALKRHLEFLDKFETIILAFDQDAAGEKAANIAVELFTPGKVRTMKFDEKDPNEMLRAGKGKEFLQALYNANIARPDGIITGADTWKAMLDRPKVDSLPFPEDWSKLNQKTYGLRMGELDTFTSGSGMGKTQMLRELEYHILQTTGSSMGIIALEEPLVDSVEALMALHLNKRIQLPDVAKDVSDEEKYGAWLATSGTNRIHYYDHFGSVDDESLISKIRYLARGLDCKYIFLDHLSIVVSEFADQGGERERIDTIMTKLKKLTQELGIWLGLVVHLRKVGAGKSFEEGAVPSLDDLRGSGSIKQLSNGVYALSRDQQCHNEQERNTSQVHVLKCRFTGRTGEADRLYFEDDTGRMVAVADDDSSDAGEEDSF